jgi:plastocyanin
MGKQTFDSIKKTLAVLLVILFIATLTTASVSGKTVDVVIQGGSNPAFNPATVQISMGDTVKWTNKDSEDHTATGSIFNSDRIHPGQSYEFQFTNPGVYNYKCLINPVMTGIIVTEYQDSEWLDSCQTYLPTLKTDVSNCEEAYNNNDMSSLSTYGASMYNDCYKALDQSRSYTLSEKYQPVKIEYETCVYHYELAGYYYSHDEYDTANKYMTLGKDDLASFKKSVNELQ